MLCSQCQLSGLGRDRALRKAAPFSCPVGSALAATEEMLEALAAAAGMRGQPRSRAGFLHGHAVHPFHRVGLDATSERSSGITVASGNGLGLDSRRGDVYRQRVQRTLKMGKCPLLTFSKIVRSLSLPASKPS